MKKKLEADLISIAHRILKLKNKSDINQLYLETQKLYEKLAVLKFVDENFEAVKPTIGQAEIESQIETIFNKEEIIEIPAEVETLVEPETVLAETNAEPEVIEAVPVEEIVSENKIEETKEIPTIEAEVIEEPVVEIKEEPIAVIEEPIIEETKEPIIESKEEIKSEDENSFRTFSELKPIPDFKPAFELETEEITEIAKEEVKEEIKEEPKTAASPIPTILFEDFGINYADAQFVKVDSFEAVNPPPSISEFKDKKAVETVITEKPVETKATTLNEKLARGFHIDLNDRIAFTKNLFGNSTEDYSRVLNQLLTFDSFSEAKDFIENMVKPDYNNWEGKDDYAERFLAIIEKKFS